MKLTPCAMSFGSVLMLAGCVAVPTAPMVTVLPGSPKPFDQFRFDDAECRNYAYSTVVGPSQAMTNTAAANAAAGTALGAAAGAIIGSASGNAGAGAAIGAGTGLLFGSAAGANAYGYSYYELQRQYDAAYIQCMYAHGNRVPMRVYGAAGGYPMRAYPVPQGAPSDVPRDYVPPDAAPNTVPPRNGPSPQS
jgi:hypothetical protein